MSAMKRLERIRVVQHELSLRELAHADAQVEATRSAIADSARAMLESSELTNATALMDADAARRSMEKRLHGLQTTRAQHAEVSRASAVARKQAEMLVSRERERVFSERDIAEARLMDDIGAQLWRRS